MLKFREYVLLQSCTHLETYLYHRISEDNAFQTMEQVPLLEIICPIVIRETTSSRRWNKGQILSWRCRGGLSRLISHMNSMRCDFGSKRSQVEIVDIVDMFALPLVQTSQQYHSDRVRDEELSVHSLHIYQKTGFVRADAEFGCTSRACIYVKACCTLW